MYPISTYDTSVYSTMNSKFSQEYVYTGAITDIGDATSDSQYTPTQNIEPDSTKTSRTKLVLAFYLERTADFLASTGGYMAGVPTGFAVGVLTKTNPLATAHIFGAAGSQLFPIIIKEVVT